MLVALCVTPYFVMFYTDSDTHQTLEDDSEGANADD